MMLTEEEAKKTECCGPRMIAAQQAAIGGRFCIASKCMAWRWYEKTHRRLVTTGQPTNQVTHYEDVTIPRDEWTGYCGLAGRPQP